MRTILFPTDFSETATNAFVYALHIASSIGAKIFVLNTYIEPVLSATHAGQPELVGQVYQSIELSKFEEYKTKTAQLRDIVKEEGIKNVELTFLFEEGSLSTVVQRIVKNEKIHLVIMGTHGQSGFLNKIIGSNTVSIIRGIQNPVLAIPHNAKFLGINRVVFTTLFRDKDKTALHEVLLMAKAVDAKIECLNVMQNGNSDNILLQTKAWQKEFPNENIDYVLLDQVESIENTITTYLIENNIDIFAVVKRNRSFFDRLFNNSISNHLAFHSKVPILVFHEEK